MSLNQRSTQQIREKVRNNTYLAATHMAVKYNKKKGVKTQVFSVGDKATIGIPKMDRAKTDMPRLPCEITEVFGDKVMTYRLGTMFGTIKAKSSVSQSVEKSRRVSGTWRS